MHNRIFWLKAFGIFLGVMAACTVLSRIAASFTVAQVTVTNPSSRSIEHIVTSNGRVEKNLELAVVTEPNILIKSILVQQGQHVDKDTILLQLDMDSLQEQIDVLTVQMNQLQTAIDRAQEDYNQTVKANQKAVYQAQQKLKTAKKNNTDVEAAQETYDAACAAQQEQVKMAKRTLEDAEAAFSNNLPEQRRRLNKLKEQYGRVYAPAEGVITSILTSVGQKTTDTAAVTMTDNSAGLRFMAQITKEDSAYVAVGDAVTLDASGQEITDLHIDTIEADETGEILTVTVLLPAGKLSLGQSASLTVTRTSERFPCTVPLTAIFQENNKNFVYIIDTEDTVLGTQTVARKIDVTVLDKNNSYAALEQNVLDSNIQIITDMDRYVEDGDTVRLIE